MSYLFEVPTETINAFLKVFWQILKMPIWSLTLVLASRHFFVVFSFEIQTWPETQHGYNHQLRNSTCWETDF